MNASAFIFSLTLAYLGMLGLCLGMERHWKQLASPRLPAFARTLCRVLGALALALTVFCTTFVWPVGMAWVAWFGMISLTGLALLMLLPYAPRLALWLPLGGLLAVGLSSLS